MRVAVSGGAGFLGRATVNRLHGLGHDTLSIDRSTDGHNAEDRWAFDVRNAEAMMKAIDGCDAVIHLAGVLGTSELFDTPELAIDVNVHGTLNVLRACVAAGATYTGIAMPPVFPSIYTATKVCATRLASAFHNKYELPVSHVKAFNAFGPGQAHGHGHPRKIVPAFSVEAWQRKPLTIWGDGEQTVDLIHTDDLAHLLVDAIGFGNDETFDGGTGTSMTVNEVARWVNMVAMNQHSGVQHMPMRPGEIPTKIQAQGEGWDLLDWRPRLQMQSFADAVLSYTELAERSA